MRRPTCETCPYWTHVDPVDEVYQHGVLVPSVDLCMYDPPTRHRKGTSRETHALFWCRKHPKFDIWWEYEKLLEAMDVFIYEKPGPFLLCMRMEEPLTYCVETGPYPKFSPNELKALRFDTIDQALEATKEWDITVPIHIKRLNAGFIL